MTDHLEWNETATTTAMINTNLQYTVHVHGNDNSTDNVSNVIVNFTQIYGTHAFLLHTKNAHKSRFKPFDLKDKGNIP